MEDIAFLGEARRLPEGGRILGVDEQMGFQQVEKLPWVRLWGSRKSQGGFGMGFMKGHLSHAPTGTQSSEIFSSSFCFQ